MIHKYFQLSMTKSICISQKISLKYCGPNKKEHNLTQCIKVLKYGVYLWRIITNDLKRAILLIPIYKDLFVKRFGSSRR